MSIRNADEVYGCPQCGNKEGFWEKNIVVIDVEVVEFDSEGVIYSGESKIDWKSQRINPQIEKPYTCNECGTSFTNPVLIDPPGPIRVK
jgi:predicted RNA-binding Zn-ribbon protein involved in translation (DUF1610 family)